MALAPKKSIALQVRKQPSVDVAPISGGSSAGVTTSSTDHAPPMVASVPSVGQVGARADGTPSEVTEQPAMEVILLPTMGQMELSTALVAPTMVGATPLIEAPLMETEVVATMIGEA